MLVKGVKRFSNGFSFLDSYTFGRTIDLDSDNDGAVTLTNIFDPDYNRGLADYDVTHTFVASFIYELPFARKHWLGGWQVNGIVSCRSGIPVNDHADGDHAARPGIGSNRPEPATSATATPPTGPSTSGSTRPRSAPRRDTATFGDIGPEHDARTEQVQHRPVRSSSTRRSAGSSSELRVEAFNVLNHPQFGQPNGQLGNAAFGMISASAPRAAAPAGPPSARSSSA